MDSIKCLEQIGLEKIARETHIERKYLQYMVDCNFDKLNRINTLGFVKIITKQYKVDLETWVNAFEEYWTQNRIINDDEGSNFIQSREPSILPKILKFLLLVIFAFGIYYAYMYVQTNFFYQENTQLEQNDTQVTVQDSIEEKDTFVLEDTNLSTIAQTFDVEEIVSEDLNNSPNSSSLQQDAMLFESILTPKSRLWMGIVYLDDYSKKSFLGEENISLDISRDQIITTGHGSFSISSKEQTFDFTRQSPVRLQISDGMISEITFEEFKTLNKGNAW
ncbi:MAG: hypothetical protein IBX44_05130 [Sulfurospirillum sp.]|nr:hypothetical protein [Sulfurospirillum sp.]